MRKTDHIRGQKRALLLYQRNAKQLQKLIALVCFIYHANTLLYHGKLNNCQNRGVQENGIIDSSHCTAKYIANGKLGGLVKYDTIQETSVALTVFRSRGSFQMLGHMGRYIAYRFYAQITIMTHSIVTIYNLFFVMRLSS